MQLEPNVARVIARKWAKFAPFWEGIPDAKRDVAAKVLILCEMVGGRNAAAAAIGMKDNTVDNYRKARHGGPSHQQLTTLVKQAQLSPHALHFHWTVEGEELLFWDEAGSAHRELSEPRFSNALHDDPPFPYVPGHDSLLHHAGMAEEVSPLLAIPPEFVRRLDVDPITMAAMLATGDSMAPGIEDGAMLLVDTSDTRLTDGCVYALWSAGALIVRRIARLADGSLELICDNRQYLPQAIEEAKILDLSVYGRVRTISRGI